MPDENNERSAESLRHEYSDTVQSIRHYSNLRFAIFTIFFAVIGGVGFVAFGKGQFHSHASLVARLGGIAVILVFWLYEERAGQLFQHHRQVAVNLERLLGYTQFITWPLGKNFLPEASVVNRLLFITIALLWIYAAFAVPLG
jgi:hypothetical protein